MAKIFTFKHVWDDQDINFKDPIFTQLEKDIPGCCVHATMATINFLLSSCLEDNEQYLEVGTYCGRTLIAGLHNNLAKAVCIDPFIHDNSAVEIYQNVEKYNIKDRAQIHHTKWEDFKGDVPPIGVYFNDGDHTEQSTYNGLKFGVPFLAKQSVILIDDYCIEEVKKGVARWREEYKDHIVFEWVAPFFMEQAIFCFAK